MMRSLFSPAVRALLFVMLLAALSLAPEPLKGRLAMVGTLHRASHIATFFAGFLFIGIRSPVRGLWAIALVIFGALLEFLQHAVYGSLLETWDILDDATGVALGFLCLRFGAAIMDRLPEH
jgi:hypothetical protein